MSDLRERIVAIVRENDNRAGQEYRVADAILALIEKEDRTKDEVFRWCYAAVVRLAQRRLADASAARESPNDWPGDMKWNQLAGSSKAIFLKRARDEAGIPNDAFLAIVRGGEIDVDDLYEMDEPKPEASPSPSEETQP